MMINMTVVFIVLVVLMYLIKLIHFIDPTKEKETPAQASEEDEPLVAVKSDVSSAPLPEPVIEEGISPEVIAVISAAISSACVFLIYRRKFSADTLSNFGAGALLFTLLWISASLSVMPDKRQIDSIKPIIPRLELTPVLADNYNINFNILLYSKKDNKKNWG